MSRSSVSIDENTLKTLRAAFAGCQMTDEDIVNEAVAMFNWAAGKKAEGKQIAAVDLRTERFEEYQAPCLCRVKRR